MTTGHEASPNSSRFPARRLFVDWARTAADGGTAKKPITVAVDGSDKVLEVKTIGELLLAAGHVRLTDPAGLPVRRISSESMAGHEKLPNSVTPPARLSESAAGHDTATNLDDPSARRTTIIYIEGVSTIERDILCDAGLDVRYCNTQALPKLRRELEVEGVRVQKGDRIDPVLMRDYVDRITWYQATSTEPVVREAIRRFKNRELLVNLGKLKSQHEKSKTYRDEAFFAEADTLLAEMRKRADAALVELCKASGLHPFHTTAGHDTTPNFDELPARRFPIADGPDKPTNSGAPPAVGGLYGVGCVTMMAAMMKRPWVFSMNGWRHLNGITSHAWDGEHAQMRSQGTDGLLKALIHGSIMTLLGKRSPWRPYYDEQKARFDTTVKHGKSGRGMFKVTPHAKAVNRVKSRIIENLKRAVDKWYSTTAGHVDVLNSDHPPARRPPEEK